MSSLARRSLRTTAAAAGIAAIGVGLAGPALAAPALPELPGGTDALGGLGALDSGALGGLGALEGMTGVPAEPSADSLGSTDSASIPGLGTFEMPTVTTAAPALPALDAFEFPGIADMDFAASDLSFLPAVESLASEEYAFDLDQDAGSVPLAGPELPALPGADLLALPGVPAAPAAPGLPSAPGEFALPETGMPEGVANIDADTVEAPDAESLGENNSVGAMQALDLADLMFEMAERAAAGESVTEGNQLG